MRLLNRTKRSLVLALLSFTTMSCFPSDVASKAARIEDLVSRYEKSGYLSGAVLVADHGNVIYARGIGEANRATHTPNAPQTKFDIASITKQFTAALVLQQAAQGKIRLDAPVSDYLPWYRRDTGTRMTINQLIHHTSGLPPDYDSPQFSDNPAAQKHYEPQEFAEQFCQQALVAEPGAKWAYSNSGYLLLGLILERVTGKPFAELLREQILEPLRMQNTGLDKNDLHQLGGAIGYVRHAGPRYTPGPYLDRGRIFAAGAMYSTVEDLFRWNQALSSDQLFDRETREKMFKAGLGNWACGWFVSKIPAGQPGAGQTLAEMRGDMPNNFFAWILHYPDQDAVIIVLRNAYGSTRGLEQNLQAILFDQPPHFPGPNPKDVVAHACQGIYSWMLRPSSLVGLAFLGLILILSFRRKTAPLAVT